MAGQKCLGLYPGLCLGGDDNIHYWKKTLWKKTTPKKKEENHTTHHFFIITQDISSTFPSHRIYLHMYVCDPQLTKLKGCSELLQGDTWPAVRSFSNISCLALWWRGEAPLAKQGMAGPELLITFTALVQGGKLTSKLSQVKNMHDFSAINFPRQISFHPLTSLKHLKSPSQGNSNSSWYKFSLLKSHVFSIPWTLHPSDH